MQRAVQQHAEKNNSRNHCTHPTMALAMLEAKHLQVDIETMTLIIIHANAMKP